MKQRPAGSNWGDYGAGDVLGRLQELTDERVVRAGAEIRTGRRFCLSLPLNYPGGNVLHPYRFPPVREFADRGGRPAHDFPLRLEREGATGVVNDDRVTIWTQYSTQWDALGHIGSHFDADGDGSDEVVYYNGRYPAPDVEAMAILGLEGRGVMVDLHRRYGREKVDVTSVMLAEVMCEQGVTVERGDILCLHTGFGQLVLDMKGSPDRDTLHNACPALDGADPELLQWVSESGVAAIVADNFAVERTPANWRSTPSPLLPLHELCLFKLGVNLGEIWYLTELAAWLHEHARFRFFLTAPPLRLPGHVGSPVTPIATV